jgi:hypothetical protein
MRCESMWTKWKPVVLCACAGGYDTLAYTIDSHIKYRVFDWSGRWPTDKTLQQVPNYTHYCSTQTQVYFLA